ncbi:hypothetical protein ACGFNP_25080 [Nonomuraea sp. NPDC049269]|uniref:hypothetical protein n=1 Tax=Nonomuraea sp. NPDC049269 TaxID=3364349 RepID=UPI00371A35D1
MTAERNVYIVDIDQPGERTLADRIMGGPIYVYGDEDLELRQEAAKKAGVKLTVRPAPKV